MAERMRDSFGADVVEWVAQGLRGAHPALDVEAFVDECLRDFDELELMARGRRIADVMAAHLPPDPRTAVPIVAASMAPAEPGLTGMAPFRLLPHALFIGAYGVPAFEESMAAQYELTKAFTAEFSIRPFLVHHRDATLERLRAWAADPHPGVRRLVSEGTRPRLPWAPRLAEFVADPRPVLELLELLRDDDSEYVRRSVANNLNDISKDHPELVVDVAGRWWSDGDAARRRLIGHGLRTLVKRGDPAALAVLGLAGADHVEVVGSSIVPGEAVIGQRVRISVEVADVRSSGEPTQVAVDLVVHFVKASGASSARVFKGGVRTLAPGQTASVARWVSLAQHTTRTHRPGVHEVEAQVNGRRTGLGSFLLRAADGDRADGDRADGDRADGDRADGG